MPNPSTLAEQEQPVEKDPDPTNYKYELRKLRTEMADMADRAAVEIKSLRAQNTALAAKADAYETVRSVVRLMPQERQGMAEDFAWRLEKRAEELRSENA